VIDSILSFGFSIGWAAMVVLPLVWNGSGERGERDRRSVAGRFGQRGQPQGQHGDGGEDQGEWVTGLGHLVFSDMVNIEKQ
jgi:hypothetical protein